MIEQTAEPIIEVNAWPALVETVSAQLVQRQVHPADALVLLPNPAMRQPALEAWKAHAGNGFAPRFETALQCANRLGGALPGPGDIRFDAAFDRLSASQHLRSAGMAPLPGLVSRVVQSAAILAQAAAAAGPQGRADWLSRARRALAWDQADSPAALDSALGRVALEWCAASRYTTDILFELLPVRAWQCLFMLEIAAPDLMAQSLAVRWSDCSVRIRLRPAAIGAQVPVGCALDVGEESAIAAALILRHVEQGQTPVALVANDRFLTRRVWAMLSSRGIALHDETGWTLSTTRTAAQIMGALRACAWDANSNQVLEWLKESPVFASEPVIELERLMREAGETQWSRYLSRHAGAPSGVGLPSKSSVEQAVLIAQLEALRATMLHERPLAQWLEALRALLQGCGLWQGMEQDDAGEQALQALHMKPGGAAELGQHPAAQLSWSPQAFMAWVDAVLEAHRFLPSPPLTAQVHVLPLGQLPGRTFAAVVMPGCDERQLPASPEPPGPWTGAQRALLGLPGRAELEAAQRRVWEHVLGSTRLSLLWHAKEQGDEPVLPSPLLRQLRLQGCTEVLPEPREWREFEATATTRPRPRGQHLPIAAISASAYEDLRRCPYRFFALRQLGLREQEEIEEEIGKREFGIWLHELLRRFHEALPPGSTPAQQEQLLDRCAQDAARALQLDAAQFLPFQAVWPNMKSAYLRWLAERVAMGQSFEAAEHWIERDLVDFKLVGRIDRIDRMPDGRLMLIDYKTEAAQKTAKRIANPFEDTQLAFYAALVEEEHARACYLNIGERGEVQVRVQKELQAACEALLDGVWSDLQRIRSGAEMPALGEGESCEHCAARGLCRKDFWRLA